MTGWWTSFGGYVIWPLRVVLSQKAGGQLWLSHCMGVKEKGRDVKRGLKNICRDPSRQSS